MKKIISLILAVLTVCSLAVFPASAADTFTEGAYTYRIATDTDGTKYAVLTDADSNQLSGTVTVPETLGGYPVGKIDNYGYESNINIEKIIIPDCVWYIATSAFLNCTSLKDVVFEKRDSQIRVYASFRGCKNLQAIHRHNGGSFIFYDNDTNAKVHTIKYVEKIEPVCGVIRMEDGNEAGWYCDKCSKYIEGGKTIPAKHTDEKDNNGYCDKCTLLICMHKCHKELTGISAFFWKVELFFWKLFNMNKECSCGAYHY